MQPPLREKRGSQAGVTLIELLIVMIILGVVTTMLVAGWTSLQRASAFAVQTNNARATARDALARISSELRDCQPLTMAIATPTPLSPFTVAQPMDVQFYSSYNQSGAGTDGSGTTKLRLTRIYLDSTQKILYWQRRPDTSPITGSWTDSGVRTVVLAKDVVNDSIPNTSVTPTTSYTAIFRYGYRDLSGVVQWTDNSAGTLDLTKVISVQARLIVDANLSHAPKYVDLTTTLRPRNASAN